MSSINEISESLADTLKDGEFQNVSIDILEAITDSMFNEGLIKDIPILGTLLGLSQVGVNLRDKLLGKKLLAFLLQLKEIPKEARLKQISKIETDTKYRTKIGEKLLFIIDKSEDVEKAELIGKLFKAFLQEKLTYDKFLRCARCVENTFLPDLLDFIKSPSGRLDIKYGSSFINAGIMALDQIKPKVTAERNRYSMKEELVYNVEKTDMTCSLTPIGHLLIKILQ